MCTHAFVIVHGRGPHQDAVPDFNRETCWKNAQGSPDWTWRPPKYPHGDGRQGAQNRSDSKSDRLNILRDGRPDT